MEDMNQIQELGSELVRADQRHLFIDGYFASRAMAGEKPSFGYPPNHLPDTTESMTIETSFFA